MNISVLGTGLMGFPIAQRLLAAGHTVTVYNRTFEKAKSLGTKGAKVVMTPQEAIKESFCIIFMLSDYSAIQEVLKTTGDKSFKDKTIIEMGTIAPLESIDLQKRIRRMGGDYFECPVLGSRREAADGTLILLVGGSREQFQDFRDMFQILGPNPRYIGGVGQALALKLALNNLIATHAAGFSLSLGLVEKNNIDVNLFMAVLRESSLYAPMFDKKLPLWLKRDYSDTNFPVKHLLKDVQLMIQETKNKNSSAVVLEAIRHLLLRAEKKGLGEQDYSAIFNAVNNI